MLKSVIFVFLGGGLGSVLRFVISLLSKKYIEGYNFIGTMLCNIIGCFFIGLLSSYLVKNYPSASYLQVIFIAGFCGGFTTFSSFIFEVFAQYKQNQIFIALLYVSLSIIIGFLFAYLGTKIIKT